MNFWYYYRELTCIRQQNGGKMEFLDPTPFINLLRLNYKAYQLVFCQMTVHTSVAA